jgi:predicted negative regulator of RcsB-dependent stress response
MAEIVDISETHRQVQRLLRKTQRRAVIALISALVALAGVIPGWLQWRDAQHQACQNKAAMYWDNASVSQAYFTRKAAVSLFGRCQTTALSETGQQPSIWHDITDEIVVPR